MLVRSYLHAKVIVCPAQDGNAGPKHTCRKGGLFTSKGHGAPGYAFDNVDDDGSSFHEDDDLGALRGYVPCCCNFRKRGDDEDVDHDDGWHDTDDIDDINGGRGTHVGKNGGAGGTLGEMGGTSGSLGVVGSRDAMPGGMDSPLVVDVATFHCSR